MVDPPAAGVLAVACLCFHTVGTTTAKQIRSGKVYLSYVFCLFAYEVGLGGLSYICCLFLSIVFVLVITPIPQFPPLLMMAFDDYIQFRNSHTYNNWSKTSI